MLLSIIVPVYNEKDTLFEILRRVLDAPIDIEREIILVDDCSVDGTGELYSRLETEFPGATIRAFKHAVNQGKGAALRTGFAQIKGDIVIIQDADLEYDPADYPKLLKPILDGRADVVYGSRFVGGAEHRVLYYWHSVGNRFLTTLSNMFTNLNLTDMETCYKVFRADVLRKIRIRSDRFGVEPELTAKLARGRWRIFEVGISYSGRSYEEGKKITW
ncbi:MAG: glycosyltransferase family 2 protein, partial [Planctomycetes bacterium]|nr:glycosyltransferase family 2 protein [Planctomycetota bacterium]